MCPCRLKQKTSNAKKKKNEEKKETHAKDIIRLNRFCRSLIHSLVSSSSTNVTVAKASSFLVPLTVFVFPISLEATFNILTPFAFLPLTASCLIICPSHCTSSSFNLSNSQPLFSVTFANFSIPYRQADTFVVSQRSEWRVVDCLQPPLSFPRHSATAADVFKSA